MKYQKSVQYVAPLATTKELDEPGRKRIQKVIGSFLYYGRAVDPTTLAALSEITGHQSKPKKQTEQQVKIFLKYITMHPEAKIRY